ncbi:sulfite exporter TauE/SafE family protein [Paenarthrobacter sp. Z7-10]|uniref:sulfite exporter TauE/SafE family protein n=1 Tax=Paenarthrobacter sp. Z7-10 TaxID=2787635 RepID=UPI0022A976B7|nr:sulfite exporter TauE/SafE family protein [Paenarthrobacter sp. Z7-10]MCZ2403979.1 sulfite exporter TauE/SafE family protein [Paenarthrobacter sp. Z7-10]
MADVALPVLVLLIVIGFVGGVGITALGPGGVLVTIGLFALTPLSPATVAGSAIVTHIGTGLLGTAAYTHSGQLRQPLTKRTALILCATAAIGTPLGVAINTSISGRMFGILLGVFVGLVAALVLYRERIARSHVGTAHPRHPAALLIALGLVVAVVSGMFGVGGPMLSVPLLLAIGVPLLPALASAQAQSVVVAAVGSVGYFIQGEIDWSIALVVGIPEVIGVIVGWKIARSIPTRRLKYALVVVLFALAPYLAFQS